MSSYVHFNNVTRHRCIMLVHNVSIDSARLELIVSRMTQLIFEYPAFKCSVIADVALENCLQKIPQIPAQR